MAPKKQAPQKLPDNVVEEKAPVVDEQKPAETPLAEEPTTVTADLKEELAAGEEQEIPTVEVNEEPAVEEGPQSPWMKVKELSDEHMTVEAINIIAHQRSQMILRFRVGDQVIPNIHVVERMHYNGNAKNPFVAR